MKKKLEPERMNVFATFHDDTEEMVSAAIGADGKEYGDDVPMELPVGMSHGPTLADMIRRMVQHQLLAVAAEAEGFESFEESEDFDIEDDPIDPQTPYEAVFDPKRKTGGVQGEAPPAATPSEGPGSAFVAEAPTPPPAQNNSPAATAEAPPGKLGGDSPA